MGLAAVLRSITLVGPFMGPFSLLVIANTINAEPTSGDCSSD